MKKIIYLLVIAGFVASCSSKPGFVINGNIKGSDSILFLLQLRDAGRTVTVDSAVSQKGIFTLKGNVVYPQTALLVAGATRRRASFFIENSHITITGSLDSLVYADIKGSKTQDEYKSLDDANSLLTKKYSDLYADYQAARQAGDDAKTAQLTKEAEAIQKEMVQIQIDFVKSHPASYVSPTILSDLSYYMEGEEIESIINAMDTAVASMPQIKSLKEIVAAMKTVAVGQKAPDFTMNDVDGNPVMLSSKIGSKLLLIDFWAAWCGPCRRENPNVVKVYNEYHQKGFDVFGVSLDRTKDEWVKAIEDDKLSWTQVSDLQYFSNTAAKMYAVNAIPANFLLDENGVIIGRNLRGEDLFNKVTEVLGASK